jgi:hypothetical protein
MKRAKFISVAAAAFAACLVFSCASTGGGGGEKGGGAGAWDFDDPAAETAGWELTPGEFYQYHGDIALSYDDTTFGNGMLRLDVDFTNDINNEWSEPKIKNDFPKAVNIKGITRFAFDFYYNPSYRTNGSFKAKVFSNNGASVDSTGEIPEGGEDAGNGFLKTRAAILIMPTAGFMPDMRFSIAGSLTDYKGPVFFDNMRWE